MYTKEELQAKLDILDEKVKNIGEWADARHKIGFEIINEYEIDGLLLWLDVAYFNFTSEVRINKAVTCSEVDDLFSQKEIQYFKDTLSDATVEQFLKAVKIRLDYVNMGQDYSLFLLDLASINTADRLCILVGKPPLKINDITESSVDFITNLPLDLIKFYTEGFNGFGVFSHVDTPLLDRCVMPLEDCSLLSKYVDSKAENLDYDSCKMLQICQDGFGNVDCLLLKDHPGIGIICSWDHETRELGLQKDFGSFFETFIRESILLIS